MNDLLGGQGFLEGLCLLGLGLIPSGGLGFFGFKPFWGLVFQDLGLNF